MVNRMQGNWLGGPGKVGGTAPVPAHPRTQQQGRSNAFSAILKSKLDAVKFSAHAEARLRSRGIRLAEEDLQRLQGAVDMAAAKGAKNALVLLGDVAMVVSVVNRTVVTAMDTDQARSNVFTNIDSAVIT